MELFSSIFEKTIAGEIVTYEMTTGDFFICLGLALALVGRNKNQSSKQAKVGIILSAIALGLSFISSMIGILLVL